MSIHFISGKPGGGKSLYAVKLIVEELVYGSRTVITNLPLKLPELNTYLQREHPSKSIDLLNRVILLDDDKETGRFWTVRPGGVRIKCLTAEEWKDGEKPSYSAVNDNGVFFVIDEIHNFFNSRAWMETGRDVLFYLSQHRKLGDTVLCVTQHIGNVDKQFRSVTQDYTYLRNLTKERMGLFRLPAVFIRKTYNEPATPTSQPMETGNFKLDVAGLASCYDTARGVGIHSRAADQGERRSGLHWAWFAVGAPALILAFLHYAPYFAAWATDPKPVVRPVVTVPTTNAPVNITTNAVPAARVAETGRNDKQPEAVTMTGYVPDGPGQFEVWLSDGRTLKTSRRQVLRLASDFCQVGTNIYYANRHYVPNVRQTAPAVDREPVIFGTVSRPVSIKWNTPR